MATSGMEHAAGAQLVALRMGSETVDDALVFVAQLEKAESDIDHAQTAAVRCAVPRFCPGADGIVRQCDLAQQLRTHRQRAGVAHADPHTAERQTAVSAPSVQSVSTSGAASS